ASAVNTGAIPTSTRRAWNSWFFTSVASVSASEMVRWSFQLPTTRGVRATPARYHKLHETSNSHAGAPSVSHAVWRAPPPPPAAAGGAPHPARAPRPGGAPQRPLDQGADERVFGGALDRPARALAVLLDGDEAPRVEPRPEPPHLAEDLGGRGRRRIGAVEAGEHRGHGGAAELPPHPSWGPPRPRDGLGARAARLPPVPLQVSPRPGE